MKYSSKFKIWWYKTLYPTIDFKSGYSYESVKCKYLDSHYRVWLMLIDIKKDQGWEDVYLGETPFSHRLICWLEKSNKKP